VALSTFSPVFVPLHVKSRYSIGIGTGLLWLAYFYLPRRERGAANVRL
jgi:hypothetical protein